MTSCLTVTHIPFLLLPVCSSMWSVVLVSTCTCISFCSDVRNTCMKPTLHNYILTNSRYSWSYEVCVWWSAEVSRHSADESLQTCISKVDVRTICELTTIRVWFFGCWLWWKYELIAILYRQLYTCLQYLTVS